MINEDEMIHCVTLLVGKRSIIAIIEVEKEGYSSFSPVSLSEFIIKRELFLGNRESLTTISMD